MNDPIRPNRWDKAVRDYNDRKKGRTPAVKAALLEKAKSLRVREAERVAAVIERDRVDRDTDLRRKTARTEVARGRFVNLEDTKDTLPPEQLTADEFIPVTVYLPEETVREHQTIRRVSRSFALWRRGVLDDDTYAACVWYRDQYDRSGLEPLIASTFDPKYGSAGRDFGHLPKTEEMADARDEYRWATRYVPEDVRPLFQLVILQDLPIRDAAQLTRCRYANANAAFRRGALALLEYAGPRIELERAIKRSLGDSEYSD